MNRNDQIAHQSVVWAGIVTFNPDMDKLRANVAAIEPQVNTVIVVDNGSDNLQDIINLCGHSVISLERNMGMAKALNRAVEAAMNAGATDIVLLDQDSVAASNLVFEESLCRRASVALVCPHVVDVSHFSEKDTNKGVAPVKRAITSGSMLNVAAWKMVGGYDERLFVDWVDNEFCDSLRVHGYEVVRTGRTYLLHEMGNQEYAWSAPGTDEFGDGRVSHRYYRQNYPVWRWKDRARSQAITIRKYGCSSIGLEEIGFLVRCTFGRILLIEKNKRKLMRAALEGFREGWRQTE